MNYLTNISRIFVAVLFILSGFIKLNDPLGFSFKLEEYFSPGVLNLPFLEPYALGIALFVVIFELVLGVMLIMGYQLKFTLWSLLGMIIFFTFLTFYSAYFNKVTDCGCFGDAVKLTPWQSFYKDIILLVFILILFFGKKHLKPLFSQKIRIAGTLVTLLLCIGFGRYVLRHLPVFDFRAYKTGTNIKEGMEIPENAPQAVYEYAWTFNINGQKKTITTLGDYPEVDGEFIEVETTEIRKGYEPPIHDFSIERNEEDHTETMLAEDQLIIITSYDLDNASEKGLKKMKILTDNALKKGYKVIGMAPATAEQALVVKENYRFNFDFYFTDQTTLKTIVRSNPGILRLKKGTILQKLHYNDAKALNLESENSISD